MSEITTTGKDIRCIITGNNTNGASIISEDKLMAPTSTLDGWPGFTTTELWYTNQQPINFNADHHTDHDPTFDIPTDATRFFICHLPPIKEIIDYQLANGYEIENEKSPGYHRTDTVDYAIVLSGEVTLIVDEEERDLKAGDCIVQRGTMHSWHNRSESPCSIAFIMLGANGK